MNVEIGTEAAQFPEKENKMGLHPQVFHICLCWEALSETTDL